MLKRAGITIAGTLLGAALIFAIRPADKTVSAAEDNSNVSVSPTETPASGPAVDVSKIALNKQKTIIKAGKKVSLVVSGTESEVTWISADTSVAKVSKKGKVTAVKKGKTVVTASVDGITKTCKVTVVPKMTKKDFSKFTGENFVSYCRRMGYDGGYAWKGQWKGDSKKRTTYRGIRIGAKKSAVEKVYGDVALTECKAKDPFTKMKGLKKNKVKYYNDEVWGKYRIRFYYNKNKKVVAIILACNIGNIRQKDLKSYI